MDVEDEPRPHDLDGLLRDARAASPNTRIGLRDPIAAFGTDAIHAVQPWLADRVLCRFAVRVIWKAGELGARSLAVEVLRGALMDPTVAVDREDLALHLQRLGYQVPMAKAEPKGSRVSSIPQRAGLGWPGFQPLEFRTTDGTHWRARDGADALTPLLLRPLRQLHPGFDSWSIYHSPEVHIALRPRYVRPNDWAQGWRASKLVVYAHGPTPERPADLPQVVAAWYIEHGDGAGEAGLVDDRWDWPYLMRMLADPRFAADMIAVMRRHGLTFGDYRAGRFGADPGHEPFVARMESDELVIRTPTDDARVLGRGLDDLRSLLDAIPDDTWRDIHIWRSWPASEAMASGGAFAHDAMLPVLEDLARLYLRVVPGGP